MSNTSNGNPAPNDVTLVAGSDGTSARTIKTDSSGNLTLGAGTAAIGTVDTELPAAAALANGAANPTAPAVGAFLLQWNGTTWDRGANQGAIGDAVSAAPWPTPASGYVYNGTSFDRARSVQGVTGVAGLGVPATVGIPVSGATAAASTYHPITQVTTASVKGSAGNVFKFRVTNENAATRFIQLHNKATAPAGTDVPVLSWKIPTGTATVPGYIEFEFKFARQFSTGIGVAISTTQATFTDSATATDHEIFVEYA